MRRKKKLYSYISPAIQGGIEGLLYSKNSPKQNEELSLGFGVIGSGDDVDDVEDKTQVPTISLRFDDADDVEDKVQAPIRSDDHEALTDDDTRKPPPSTSHTNPHSLDVERGSVGTLVDTATPRDSAPRIHRSPTSKDPVALIREHSYSSTSEMSYQAVQRGHTRATARPVLTGPLPSLKPPHETLEILETVKALDLPEVDLQTIGETYRGSS